ncbi:MAG: HEAT repeat domain-containing protein [Candidatus Lokiarchaeota archaeon]|nr:HEAT repeat domain-containing protein [Candidatus Lokiarchaeota archaeon]
MSVSLEQLLRDARVDLVLSRIEKDELVIEEVINHLENNSRSVKFNAILVLGELGQKSINGLSKLNACLEDNDWSICREAVRTLGKIGEIAKESIPQLSRMLKDKEESIRKEAAIAIGKIGSPTQEAISSLINALKDKNEVVRTEAAKALGRIGQNAHAAIPHLMESLKDVEWTVRTASAQSLSQIGKESKMAIPSLISALEDKDWRVRYRVSNTLIEIGEEVVPSLLEILNHKNSIVRKGAIDTLGDMGFSDPNIIDGLSNLLSDKVEAVRGKTAYALRSIGKEAVPVLLKGFEKSKKGMKNILISALGGIGTEAKEALPNLIDFLKLPDQEIEYIPTFTNKLKRNIATFFKDPFSNKASIRVESARALGKVGINSEEAVYALEKALNDPKKIVRREAALSIGKLGSSANIAIPSLIKALKDENPDVRWRVSEALGLIGVDTEDVIDGLKELIHDECDYVCESAINALDNLTEE